MYVSLMPCVCRVQQIVSSFRWTDIAEVEKEASAGEDEKAKEADDEERPEVPSKEDTPEVQAGTESSVAELSGFYLDGINAKSRRMRWSCLHACLVGFLSPAVSVSSRVNLLTFLLQNHAYVDSLDIECRTPAMYAAIVNMPSALQLLIDAGADLTMKDLDGNTVRHLAYMFKSSECLRLLNAMGNSEDSTNILSKTPLEMAGKGKRIHEVLFYSW